MFGKSLLCLVTALLPCLGHAQDVSKYVEIIPGTLPIILTVPHGGDLKPESILARRYGVTAKDANTAELSLMIQEEMEALYGGKPHAVICRLHRSKVDCNRDLAEAAQGDPVAIATWQRFHGAAEAMETQITRQYGAGLTLDIHGHRHEDPRVELGYLISGLKLNVTDEILNTDPGYWQRCSIRELVKRSPQTLAELIRGPQSLGAMLQARDFKSIPSPDKPSPGTAVYFSGSYNITAHGSRDGGTISAIQIECPWLGVRDTAKNKRRFAQALAASLGPYFELHFKMPLGTSRR